MQDNFEAFTEKARNVLRFAQEESTRLNHNYIGTEHLLLGLIRDPDSPAAQILSNLRVQFPKVRSAVEYVVGHAASSPAVNAGLTARAKRVIALSVDEARRLNDHHIGTEHLLLGLVREGEGIAAGILESLGDGVTLAKVRAQVRPAESNGIDSESVSP